MCFTFIKHDYNYKKKKAIECLFVEIIIFKLKDKFLMYFLRPIKIRTLEIIN